MLLRLHVSQKQVSQSIHVKLALDGGHEAAVDLGEQYFAVLPAFWRESPEATEKAIAAYGMGLHRALFQSNAESIALWGAVQGHQPRLRIEVEDATGLVPWELLRDPRAALPLACQAQSFTRTAAGGGAPAAHLSGGQKIKALLVVPRIFGKPEAAYRSTALRLVNGLCAACREYFQLDWLDFPSLERLEERLREAKEDGSPYQLVHYEGHGVHALEGGDPGYLVLESPGGAKPASGREVARVLAEGGAPILALHNPHGPQDGADDTSLGFQTVAAQALEAGLPGVLVMPWLMDGSAAAAAAGDIYAALAQGESLGSGVTSERRYWYGKSLKSAPAWNWCVPLVYENRPAVIAEKAAGEGLPVLRISILPEDQERFPPEMDEKLREAMTPGRLKERDRWVLALDHACEISPVLLLQGRAGLAGAAGEYARFLGNAGFLNGQPVLYTSLRDCFGFTDLMDRFGAVYEHALRGLGVAWQPLEDRGREKLIQDLAKKVPLFWVWDHAETLRRPSGLGWGEGEAAKLLDFLKGFQAAVSGGPDGAAGVGRILILSRAEETGLEDAALRVAISHREEVEPQAEPAAGLDQPARLSERARQLMASSELGEAQAGDFTEAAAGYARELLAAGQVSSRALEEAETGLRAALELALRYGRTQDLEAVLPALRLAMAAARRYLPWARVLERCGAALVENGGRELVLWGRPAALWLLRECAEAHRLRGDLSEARRCQAQRVEALRSYKKRHPAPETEQEYAEALSQLAELHISAGSSEAETALRERFRLAKAAGDTSAAANAAFRLAYALAHLPAAQSLPRARRWLGTCRSLLVSSDAAGLARCALLEAKIESERFNQAQKANRPAEQLVKLLNEALSAAYAALETALPGAPLEAARAHEMLGFLYLQADQMVDEAVAQYEQAIQLFEQSADPASAARARFNLAVALFLLSQFDQARRYAQDALHSFESLGDACYEDALKARRLVERYAVLKD